MAIHDVQKNEFTFPIKLWMIEQIGLVSELGNPKVQPKTVYQIDRIFVTSILLYLIRSSCHTVPPSVITYQIPIYFNKHVLLYIILPNGLAIKTRRQLFNSLFPICFENGMSNVIDTEEDDSSEQNSR